MRSSYIIIFLLFVVTVVALSPDEEAFWQDPQYVASLTNNEFFKAIKDASKLLENEYVFASIDTRLRDPNVIAYLNHDEKLLQYWGKKKGIEFDPGAGFTKYEKGYITTKGKGIVFKPEDVPGARVLSDGSVMFGSALIEQGKVAKSVADEVMVQGTVVDTKTKTRFSTDKFNIGIGIDRYSIRENVAVTTVYGSYTLNSKQWFKIEFDGNNPLIRGTNVEIIPPQHDNTFMLENGGVILYDNERFGLDANTKIRFGDALTGRETDVFAVTNTIKVDKPTHFCFTECNGIEHVLPEDYQITSIEVLRNRQFGDNDPINRLKITARDTTNIDVNLQNPEYESIYADAHRGGSITVVQHGKNVAPEATATSRDGGFPTTEYYSEAVVSPDVEGMVKVKGEGDKPLGGSTLLVPGLDEGKKFIFGSNGEIVGGYVGIYDVSSNNGPIVADDELNDFNLRDYHAGRPLGDMIHTSVYRRTGKEGLERMKYASVLRDLYGGSQWTPQQEANALRTYAEREGLSLEDAFKKQLAVQDLSWRLKFMAEEKVAVIAQELGFEKGKADVLIREVLLEEVRKTLHERGDISKYDLSNVMTFEELDTIEKQQFIEQYVNSEFEDARKYTPEISYNTHEQLIKYRQHLPPKIYEDLMRDIVDRYGDDGQYTTALKAMESAGVYTPDEIQEARARLDRIRSQPPYVISDQEIGNAYRRADDNRDNLIEPVEMNKYNRRDRDEGEKKIDVIVGPYSIGPEE